MIISDFLRTHEALGRVCFFGDTENVIVECYRHGWCSLDKDNTSKDELLLEFNDTVISKMALIGPLYEDKGIVLKVPVAICFIPFGEDV